MLPISERRLATVHREVADPLEIGVDLESRHDKPQVDGDGMSAGDQFQATIVDLDLQLVDRPSSAMTSASRCE